jgi:hypothetical protein
MTGGGIMVTGEHGGWPTMIVVSADLDSGRAVRTARMSHHRPARTDKPRQTPTHLAGAADVMVPFPSSSAAAVIVGATSSWARSEGPGC